MKALTSFEERYGPLTRRLNRLRRAWRWRAKCASRKPARILVETRWRLGDEIMALPIYEALKTAFPFARVDAWCNYPDLLLDSPYVDTVYEGTAIPDDDGVDRYILMRGAPRDRYRREHYAALAGVPTPECAPRLYYRDWTSPMVRPHEKTIAVSTGASWPTKRWPIDLWRELCQALEEEGYRLIQLGKDDEIVGLQESFLGKTGIRDAACLLHAARLFICCDSGLMHLAQAAGTPAIALFGPTDPAILLRPNEGVTAITNARPCFGCWNISQDMQKEGVCPIHEPQCLGTITPARVLQVVHEVLARE
ncbi:MAG: glycosyltransferase family 9 protein [Candidatus Hydrogenedentes bacterium]|nr:glycosyltransferase family 9 protein [Candidatus Hydrogenedentota bacterium]